MGYKNEPIRSKSEKGPGMAENGYKPSSKVNLEGPKKHHDDHGPNASVPGKGDGRATPKDHWEMHYDVNAPSKDLCRNEGNSFNPISGSKRESTQKKVNAEDH